MESLKALYDRLTTERSPYLTKARDCSKFTLPWLVPPSGATGSTKLRTTFSSFGARCVNSLSSKLTLALFPARQAFFRFGLSKEIEAQLGGDAQRAAIEKALAGVERSVMDDINTTPVRSPAGEAVKHLLVAGNVLVHDQPDGGLKLFPLDSYVVIRDASGNQLKIVAKESVALAALPDGVRQIVGAKIIARASDPARADEAMVDIYTGIIRTGGQYVVSQECEGVVIPSANGTYPLDSCPWFALRWIPDKSYGRGLVEDYLGHLITLESLTASLVKGTAVAAKVIFLRKPNSSVQASKLTRAETGAVVDGNIEDVAALQVDKRADFATAKDLIASTKEELAFAFVMNQAVQRQAERVTAEEIRTMVQDLDTTLGGNYSTLANEFQLPFLRSRLRNMQGSGKLPQLPSGALRPTIVTGLEALGRGADLDNLKALVKDVVDLGGVEALQTYVHFDNLLSRLTTARGVVPEGLIRTAAEVKAAEAEKQQAAMMQQLGPNAINQLGGLAKQGMANQAQPTQ